MDSLSHAISTPSTPISHIHLYSAIPAIHPIREILTQQPRCWNQFLRGNATEDVSPSWISRIVILRILSQAIHQHLFEVDPMLSTNIFNLGAAELKKPRKKKMERNMADAGIVMDDFLLKYYTLYIYTYIYT